MSGFKTSVRSLKRLCYTTNFETFWDKQFFKDDHFEIQDGGWVLGCIKTFLKNSVPQDPIYYFVNFTYSFLALHGPFPTVAHYIKIIMLTWWPSWKSIWLPSIIYLTALIQNISFAAEMNFLFLLVLKIWKKPSFRKVAILKSKMADGWIGYIKNGGKNMFLEGGHFEIQDGGWMHACTTIFPQNFCLSRCIVLVIWQSFLNLHDPFPTIARYIKINTLKCRPSWKSIWLPSQCFDIYLSA